MTVMMVRVVFAGVMAILMMVLVVMVILVWLC